MRRDVAELLARRGASAEFHERVALVVTELAANAVQAAPGRPYVVEASIHDDVVIVRVRNHTTGAGPPPRAAWTTPDHAAPRGRGLPIVASLADEAVVHRPDHETVEVTARLRFVRATTEPTV